MRPLSHTAFVALGKIATVVAGRVAIVAIGNVALVATAGNKSFAGKCSGRIVVVRLTDSVVAVERL